MIRYTGKEKDLVNKYGFHKGYNQHNDNKKYFGVLMTDNIRISYSDGVISVGDNLWISYEDYYSWSYLDVLYRMIKDGVVEQVKE